MSTGDWISVLLHGLSVGIDAAFQAGRAKRAEITGQTPDIGWRQRQEQADAARKAATP